MHFSYPIITSIFLTLVNCAPFDFFERDIEATYNSSLPTVKIFGTGGTIASKGSSGSQTSGYSVGLTVEDLIDAVPELEDIANLDYIQISNIGSGSITYEHLIPLYKNITETLASDDYDGAVVTHGTDTLEETAFFLELTVKTEKPICVVGAMRPSTATSADGPMNLYQAVAIAGSEKAKGRGTLITMNDRIASAFYSTKMNSNTMDTFKAQEQGFLGAFFNNGIEFFYSPSRPTGYHQFDLSNITDASEIPEVVVLYGHQGSNKDLAKLAVEELGAKGLILVGTGAGGWPAYATATNEELVEAYGIPIIRSHRPIDGKVGERTDGYSIGSGYLNPQKARIMLQLALYSGYSNDQIRDLFAGVFGG